MEVKGHAQMKQDFSTAFFFFFQLGSIFLFFSTKPARFYSFTSLSAAFGD